MTPDELKAKAESMPDMPYQKESIENQAMGADILGELVRSRLFDDQNPSMPPPEVFRWYVNDVVYRFLGEEHIFIHLLDQDLESSKSLQAVVAELNLVMRTLAQNSQFALQHDVNEKLRVRRLKLPEGYNHTYDGALTG